MAAPPVVGENRIRGVGGRRVLYHQYFNAVFTQGIDVAVELLQRFMLCPYRVCWRLLKAVVDRGIRVEGKVRRADHQDGVGGLHGARVHGLGSEAILCAVIA